MRRIGDDSEECSKGYALNVVKRQLIPEYGIIREEAKLEGKNLIGQNMQRVSGVD